MRFFKQTKKGQRPALTPGLAGIALVALRNWQLWRHDQALAAQLRAECQALPALAYIPSVSVLVAAWNESDCIEAHLGSFLALRYPKIELILCAGGTDTTFEQATAFQSDRLKLLPQYPGDGKQRSLARCLELASGEIIYLTDADCLYSDEALLSLLVPLVNEAEQVATGLSRPLDTQLDRTLPFYLWASDTAASQRSPAYVGGLLGRNTALTRKVLDQSGGLDFVAPTGTDYQLAKRLLKSGFAIRHIKNSVVSTLFPASLGVYRRKQSRWLRNLLLYGPRYGAKADTQAALKTVAIGAVMLTAPLTFPLLGSGVLILWLWLVTHAALSKLRYSFFTARLYQKSVPARLPLAVLPLTLLEFAIWVGPLIDLLKSKGRTQW
jgi:cellulose synthase/poly-beta-1,6-N-acetylglucosamine synthase-like glycosyltransferase